MDKTKLEKYAELKIKIKEMEQEVKEMMPEILSDMLMADIDKVETDAGNFIVEQRKVWKFSEELDNMKQILKDQEKEEMANGIAEFEFKKILMFKGIAK